MIQNWCEISPKELKIQKSTRSAFTFTVRSLGQAKFLKVSCSNPNLITFVKNIFNFPPNTNTVVVQAIYNPEYNKNGSSVDLILEEVAINGLENMKIPIEFIDEIPSQTTQPVNSPQESTLTCKICEEQYSDAVIPRILTTCGHTVCHNCANGIFRTNGNRSIPCPFDRYETIVTSVDQLPKNYAILEMTEDGKNKTKESMKMDNLDKETTGIPCIENAAHSADWWCSSCNADYCEKCYSTAHSLKVLSGHSKIPISQKPRQLPKCSKHPDLTAEFYCEMEESIICENCVKSEDHNGHSVKKLIEKVKEREEELEKVRNQLKDVLKSEKDDHFRIAQTAYSYRTDHPHYQLLIKSIMDFYDKKKEEAVRKFQHFTAKNQRIVLANEEESVRDVATTLEDLANIQSISKSLQKFEKLDISPEILWGNNKFEQADVNSLLDCIIDFPRDFEVNFKFAGN